VAVVAEMCVGEVAVLVVIAPLLVLAAVERLLKLHWHLQLARRIR
jgi:hypothetical protein